MVRFVTVNAPMVVGARHVGRHVTAVAMARAIPRVANASVTPGGPGWRVTCLVQVGFMVVNVNTSKLLVSNVFWTVESEDDLDTNT